MKNLALLLLFLNLFMACKQKEEKLPVNPEQWLSQIKNEEAKKRTTDVLEKIYISTAYSVAEKDSLSEMQTRLSNCKLYDSTQDIRMFKKWIKGDYFLNKQELNVKYLSRIFSLYNKDDVVFKAALNVLLDTNFLHITDKKGLYSSFYDTTNQAAKISISIPSEKLLNMENKVLELMDSMRGIDYGEQEKIRKITSKKLFQLLKEPTSYDYALPRINKKLEVLYSPDKKLRVFYFSYFNVDGMNGIVDFGWDYTADVYIQYRKSKNDKLIVEQIKCREVNGNSYCYPRVPAQIFQVERNGNPVFIILHEYNGNMGGERYTILQAIEIKDGKAIPCKDCIEGEELKVYHRYNRTGSFPVFNVEKQQLALISHPFVHTNLNLTVIRRYVLQWNGQQLVSIPLKLYCEE
ncbi:hypothetical protein V9L05_10820 [Bernardetia sp. Wsw4-3y2]|uniref:hypothetical protein n=1 Tax=Bernardetia sp. Wsw4-3y2 TaxID=3127471 RepID=UPI0030D0D19C